MSSHPLMGASLPPITPEMIAEARKVFPIIRAVPNVTTQDELMYNAGQQDLIDWLEQFARKPLITGSL